MSEQMLEEKKDGFLDRQMTRRQFLKISGKSLAGLTISATMLNLFGCTQQEVDEGVVTTWATPTGLLVVNGARCVGCQRCEINCTLTNDGKCGAYISRIKMARNLHIHGKDGMYNQNFTYFPDTCRQCKTLPAAKLARNMRSMPMTEASVSSIGISVSAVAHAMMHALGICRRSIRKHRNPASAFSVVPA